MDSEKAIIYKRARELAAEDGVDWDTLFQDDRQKYIDGAKESLPHGPHGIGCTCDPSLQDVNKRKNLYRSAEPDTRMTRLAAVALDAMKHSVFYRDTDKMIVMCSEQEAGECADGTGFFNLDGPIDLIGMIAQHLQACGDAYGVGVGVAELSEVPQEERPQIALDALIGAVVRQMMLDELRKGNDPDVE